MVLGAQSVYQPICLRKIFLAHAIYRINFVHDFIGFHPIDGDIMYLAIESNFVVCNLRRKTLKVLFFFFFFPWHWTLFHSWNCSKLCAPLLANSHSFFFLRKCSQIAFTGLLSCLQIQLWVLFGQVCG